MPEKIIKKDGREEEFSIEKLRNAIEKAVINAEYKKEETSKVVEEVVSYVLESIKDLETVDSESLRNLILAKLDESYPEVASSWREYEEKVKER